MMKKLRMCPVCNRPLVLYGPSEKSKKVIMKQGPGKGAIRDAWCNGHCEGLIADLDYLLDHLSKPVNNLAKRVLRKERMVFVRDFIDNIQSLSRLAKLRGSG